MYLPVPVLTYIYRYAMLFIWRIVEHSSGRSGNVGDERQLITLGEARERLGVSKVTMARLVKEGRFTVYDNPLDRREKLVEEREVLEAVRPRPTRQTREGE